MVEREQLSGAPLTGTGSREPSPSVSAASGFDPSRVADRIKFALLMAPDLGANLSGELLRALCFPNGYGAYSSFDLVDGFEAVDPRSLSLPVRTALSGCWAKDQTTIRQMRAFRHSEARLTVAWYWDGDGTLVFSSEGLLIYNSDCKKDDEWESSEPGDWIHTYDNYETAENYPRDSDRNPEGDA